jgi:hypothetical protein
MQADCKISVVPIALPCLPNVRLNLVICNGIGQDPLMLVTNLASEDSRLCVVITKVYLPRWRIEEFYRFKKQQMGFDGFRVRSLHSIRSLDLLVSIAVGWIEMMSKECDGNLTRPSFPLTVSPKECSSCFAVVQSAFTYILPCQWSRGSCFP